MANEESKETTGAAADAAAFLASLKVEEAEPVEVEGALVKPIGDAGYSRVRALRDTEAMKHKGDERMAVYATAERAAYLSVGVVQPQLPFRQWLHVLETANTAKIDAIIGTIKGLSGIDDGELVLAKKALEQMLGTSES